MSVQSTRPLSLHHGRASSPGLATHMLRSTFLPARVGLPKVSCVALKRGKMHTSQVVVNATAKEEVVMVDPIEAKRLAAEKMKQLQTEAKFKKRRRIEAINGGWAMLGLTACIVIEGYTGKTILSQVAGYLHALADIVDKYLPSSEL